MKVQPHLEFDQSLNELVMEWKSIELFRRYGLVVREHVNEYNLDDWKRLALALAFKHERKLMAQPKTSRGPKTKWTRSRLFHLLACVEAVKRERGVTTGKEAIHILTTEFADGAGPQNRKGWQPRGGEAATKKEALKAWQEHLERRLSEAKKEYRRWKDHRPRGLLHTLGFFSPDD